MIVLLRMPSASGEASPPAGDGGPSLQGGDQPYIKPPSSDENLLAQGVSSFGRRRAVLVVDDEPTVRLLITEVLHDLDYTSLEAVDGPSGLQILQSDTPIDLLITDIGLPGGMDGRHLASAARAERPGLAILFITGYAETAALGDGVPEPGTMVLAKPFSINALAAHIRELTS